MDLSKIPALDALKDAFHKLPGVGPKLAMRLALHAMRAPEDEVSRLTNAIHGARTSISLCPQCNGFVDGEGLCFFCRDTERQDSIICIVEDPMVPLVLETKQKANWRYHITHGLVSPLEEKFPEDLLIQNLWARLATAEEVIMTFSSSMEGEATAAYLTEEIKNRHPNIKITRIAHGIPFGARLDGVDQMTLIQALRFRQPAV